MNTQQSFPFGSDTLIRAGRVIEKTLDGSLKWEEERTRSKIRRWSARYEPGKVKVLLLKPDRIQMIFKRGTISTILDTDEIPFADRKIARDLLILSAHLVAGGDAKILQQEELRLKDVLRYRMLSDAPQQKTPTIGCRP